MRRRLSVLAAGVLMRRRLSVLVAVAVVAAVSALLAPAAAAESHGSKKTIAALTSTYQDVSAGGKHSCGLSTSGTITCWGNNDDGQTNAPSGSFKAVTAGYSHSCGLSTSGTITCWGYNDDGQTNAPSGSFKAVSSGSYHICGLSTSGTITCWGWNDDGQTDAPSGSFSAVSAGGRHSCGLSTSNTISCWGSNYQGQTDAPSGSFKAVSVDADHSCGLSPSGTITCWGSNGYGKTTAPSGSFSAVSAGGSHSCGLSTSNTIACWGGNIWGQSTAPSGSFSAVSAGGSHSCGLSTSNTIACWGNNDDGQSNAPSGSTTTVSVPGKVGRPSVSVGDGSLTVSWSAPSNGGSAITGYEVWYSTSSQSRTRTTASTTVTLTGLANGTSYTVYVRAQNSQGYGSWSDSSSGTPVASATRPDPVRQISVTPGDGSLTVSWLAPSDGGSAITGYEVSYIESQFVGCGDCGVVADVITTTSLRTTISGLTNGTSYTVYVRARNSVGVGLWVTNASGTPQSSATVPGKVGRPTLVAGDARLTVSWSAPSNGGSSITDYDVRYIESSYIGCADCGTLPWVSWQSSTVSTSRSTTITGLSNGTSYAVEVRAKNSVGAGTWSDDGWATPQSSATVPGKVGRPTLVPGDGSLAVSWSAPSDGGSSITRYEVWYSPETSSQSWTRTTTSTSMTLTGLTNGSTYRVHVRAQNSQGWGSWSAAASGAPQSSATVPGKPAAPTVSAGDGSLTVWWSVPSNGGATITGFDVRASSQDGTHERTQGTGYTTGLTVTGLINGKTYNVVVRAKNSVGSGSWSDAASGSPMVAASTPGTVGRPTLVPGDGSLTVSWSAPSDGGSSITGYEVWYGPETSSQSWTRTTTLTSMTLAGLTNGTTYRVHVRAQNSQGFGTWSDGARGTPVGAATVPGKPAAPSVTAGDGSLTVSWFAPSDGGAAITDYDVRYIESSYIGCGDCGALPWVDWQSSTVSTSWSTTITGLTNGTSYAVEVRAKNSVGPGAWSDDAWGTPVTAATVPAKPAAPSVTAGDGSLTVSWSPPADGGSAITGYVVWYSPDTSSQYWTHNTTSTSVTITGLTNATTYRVHVRAQNAEGLGEWSEGASATPQSEGSVPAKIGQLSVVAGDRSLTVSWSPPADGGSAITGYEVWYSPDGSSQSRTHRTTATSATLTSLTNGTRYAVHVRAQNAAGLGGWSDRAFGTPKVIKAPSEPIVTLSQNQGRVTLRWVVHDNGGAPVTDHRLYYRISRDPFDPDLKSTNADRQEIDKDKDCLLSASFTTSSYHTSTSSHGTAILRYDSPCGWRSLDDFFKTLEFRVAVKNSANPWSWSTPQRLTLMPWKAPAEIPRIDSLWVREPGFIGDAIDLVPFVTRLPAVVVEFNTIHEASEYKVEWKRDDDTSGSHEIHVSKAGHAWPTGESITIGNVLETDPKHHFRVVASNSFGSTTSEWKTLEDVVTEADMESMKSDIQNNCSSIDSRNVASENMRDVLNTVALAAHTRSFGGARFGDFLKAVGRFGRGASWTSGAIWIIDELDKCNGDVGAFVRNLPILKEIIEGYNDNPLARTGRCGGRLGDQFFECFYGE